MEKLIVIRYAEMHLKGRNIAYFESMLLRNIKKSLKGIVCEVYRNRCRYSVEKYDLNDESEIISRLKKVCGIHSISPAFIVNSTLEDICKTALLSVDFTGTFKIETNRADKRFPLTSVDVSREVGGYVLENAKGLTVDVKNPQHVINIDMRENKKTFVYEQTIYGVGGLPYGSSGSGVVMLSGGIDSPVATYMIAKRGMKLSGVYFHSYPYTSDLAKEKVIALAKKLSAYAPEFRLNVVPFTHIQEAIHKACNEEFMITLMRRFMMRISERIAKQSGALAIVTGEDLGQVASQTIESITVTNAVVDIPVLRPLIGFDKLEIIKIARDIDTYNTSILPYEDCCTVFLPKNPLIKPKMNLVLEEEQKLDIEALIDDAMANIEVIDVCSRD